MRKKILAANWKMNLSADEVQDWLTQFQADFCENDLVELRLYAPALYLQWLSGKNTIHVGAQNVYPLESGAFTGEISIPQLQSIEAKSVLIGHSERRSIFQESDAFLKEKVDACCQHEFSFIFCCGEDLSIRQKQDHLPFLEAQLNASLLHLNKIHLSLLTIAYEPIWAIGTGETANTDQINEVHAFIRKLLVQNYGDRGAQVPILYGGSVNTNNAQSIFSCPDVDGGLIGGASLKASSFLELASSF
ncbi:MAG: triose-phosphate isomerase [Flavobacteriales bacterium]